MSHILHTIGIEDLIEELTDYQLKVLAHTVFDKERLIDSFILTAIKEYTYITITNKIPDFRTAKEKEWYYDRPELRAKHWSLFHNLLNRKECLELKHLDAYYLRIKNTVFLVLG